MRLDINYREKKQQNPQNPWRLNNTLLNNKEVTEEIRKEIRRFLETNDNENTVPQNLRLSKSSSKRDVYSDTIIPQEARKASNRQPNATSKAAGKRRTKIPKVSIKKEIIKIRAEITERNDGNNSKDE